MSIIQVIKDSWGWVGINPISVVGENNFDNLLIEDIEGRYWRLCPEDLYCEVVAGDRHDLERLF